MTVDIIDAIALPGARVTALTWSPDNQYIAYIASLWKQAPTHLYIISKDGTGQTDVTPELWLATKAFWSKRDDMIAIIDGQQSIFILQFSRN